MFRKHIHLVSDSLRILVHAPCATFYNITLYIDTVQFVVNRYDLMLETHVCVRTIMILTYVKVHDLIVYVYTICFTIHVHYTTLLNTYSN